MHAHLNAWLLVIVLMLPGAPAAAQEGARDIGARLLEDAAVARAVEHARTNEQQLLEDQIRLCEIPAPPFKEQARAEAYRQLFTELGLANPVHALGRAIAKIADFQVPSEPKTTFNVGRVGGGTSVNSIAFEAWMEVDMRSPDAASLAAIDKRFLAAVDEALTEENTRWSNKGEIALDKKPVGDRPAGQTPEDAPIVQAAQSVTRALDLPAELRAGSTDSNIPMSLGIPSITIDGGGQGTGSHSLDETFDTTNSWQGTARAVLLAIALAQR